MSGAVTRGAQTCAVCGAASGAPIYESPATSSLTSLCTIRPEPTVVLACESCGHLQSPSLHDLDGYYRSAYRILLQSEEEDQLYAVDHGRQIFRAEHQAKTLLGQVDLPRGARILDYGAAKGATMRLLMDARPDVHPCFFDVSDMYVPYWRKLVEEDAFATHELPVQWEGSFDCVTSFFMLEHVERPVDVLTTMRTLIKPGGLLYLLVPNPGINIADFVVVDHVNHFTGSSLERALLAAGFVDLALHDNLHDGAWVATGRRPEPAHAEHAEHAEHAVHPEHLEHAQPVDPWRAKARELACYWREVSERIARAEREVGDRPSAVYGAGFYGAFIRVNLERPDLVVAHVDQNPHLQGTEFFDRPVVGPDALDPAIRDIYVGLNPGKAHAIISGIASWAERPLRFHYL